MNREQFEVTARILLFVLTRKKALITQILYASSLSGGAYRKRIEALVTKELLKTEIESGKTYFSITEKGREWLSHFTALKKLEQ